MSEWCYFLQIYADNGTDKYKIGRTNNIKSRLRSAEYRNAIVHETIQLNDSRKCESEIIREFKKEFVQVTKDDKGGYGKEYFRGELDEMLKKFKEICSKYKPIENTVVDEETSQKVELEEEPIKENHSITDVIRRKPFVLHKVMLNHFHEISWNTYSIGDNSIRIYKYRDIPEARLEQLLSNGFIIPNSLCKALGITAQRLGAYLRYFNFYAQLMMIDPSLPRMGYVYLIIFEKTFKIGKTGNFDRRYDVQTRSKDPLVVPVSNHDMVEHELIQAYRAAGYETVQGNEYFKLDNEYRVKTIFRNTLAGKEVLPYNWRDSKLIQTYRMPNDESKLCFHPKVCEIFVNKFTENEDERKKFNQFLDLISKQISNGYFDQIYDNQSASACSYWQYFNFVAIRRWKDDKVNVSRLFNSIRKQTKNHNQHPVSEIVRSIAENKNIKAAFEKKFPDKTIMEYYENKEQPYLSGYYLDIVLVPTFVGRASSEALLDLNELLLYLGSEAFAGSSVDEAKTNLQLHKYLSEKKLIHHEISYGLDES